jgi:S-disulfanyl-L-cysteine oxidoreductase SoxD
MIQRVLIAVAIAGSSIGITLAAGQAPTKTTNDGVYTAAQADRGKKVFESKCTGCHEPSRFTGETFYEAFDGKAMKEIWDIASGTMPEDNPGSLKPQEYGDILAYFLALNEFKAGETELQGNASAMAAIKVEKKK